MQPSEKLERSLHTFHKVKADRCRSTQNVIYCSLKSRTRKPSGAYSQNAVMMESFKRKLTNYVILVNYNCHHCIFFLIYLKMSPLIEPNIANKSETQI